MNAAPLEAMASTAHWRDGLWRDFLGEDVAFSPVDPTVTPTNFNPNASKTIGTRSPMSPSFASSSKGRVGTPAPFTPPGLHAVRLPTIVNSSSAETPPMRTGRSPGRSPFSRPQPPPRPPPKKLRRRVIVPDHTHIACQRQLRRGALFGDEASSSGDSFKRWPCTSYKPFSVLAIRALLDAADQLGEWPEEEVQA